MRLCRGRRLLRLRGLLWLLLRRLRLLRLGLCSSLRLILTLDRTTWGKRIRPQTWRTRTKARRSVWMIPSCFRPGNAGTHRWRCGPRASNWLSMRDPAGNTVGRKPKSSLLPKSPLHLLRLRLCLWLRLMQLRISPHHFLTNESPRFVVRLRRMITPSNVLLLGGDKPLIPL